jgi:hypothetical protein
MPIEHQTIQKLLDGKWDEQLNMKSSNTCQSIFVLQVESFVGKSYYDPVSSHLLLLLMLPAHIR